MPFPMKIQPIDCDSERVTIRNDQVKPLVKSRFKRLFEWQFSKERLCGGEIDEYELNSSVCLAKMVQNFIEENNEKHSVVPKCSRNHRCNCFHGNCSDSSDEDDGFFFSRRSSDSLNAASAVEASELLKNLVSCVSNAERSLLADTTKIVERNKICNCKRKDDCRKTVIESLVNLGYDASICKSRWEKSSSFPSGEYEYIDVIIEGERLLIDIDFKSEFEIARSTGTYRSILQSLPSVFVGKTERLQQIVSIVSDAAKQSLKKKGMHIPPWRKTEYMRAKWLSPYTRTTATTKPKSIVEKKSSCSIKTKDFSGEFELIFKEKDDSSVLVLEDEELIEGEEKIQVVVTPWEPPAVKPKSTQRGTKIVAGLASVFKEKP